MPHRYVYSASRTKVQSSTLCQSTRQGIVRQFYSSIFNCTLPHMALWPVTFCFRLFHVQGRSPNANSRNNPRSNYRTHRACILYNWTRWFVLSVPLGGKINPRAWCTKIQNQNKISKIANPVLLASFSLGIGLLCLLKLNPNPNPARGAWLCWLCMPRVSS